MADWTLTAGLQNLRAQVNGAFPRRDRTSDGSIGDVAHQGRTSGHNPDDTDGSKPAWDGDGDSVAEVRAWDMDADLGDPDVTAQELVDHLRRLPGLSSVVRYLIFNRKLYHSRDGFAASDYTGSNPHTQHVHVEGAWTQAADNNTTFDYRMEDLVAPTIAEIKAALNEVIDDNFARGLQPDGTPTSKIGRDAFDQGIPNGLRAGSPRDMAWEVLRQLGVAVGDVRTLLGRLSTTVAAMAAGQATQADVDELRAAVDQVDESVVAALLGGSDQQTADVLLRLLGDRVDEVLALMQRPAA